MRISKTLFIHQIGMVVLIKNIQFHKDFKIRESSLTIETQVLEDLKIRNFGEKKSSKDF